jgi:hypothetical protein
LIFNVCFFCCVFETPQGTRTWPNGDTYTGAYTEGKENGMGEFRGINGFTYNGMWKMGVMSKRGKCVYPNGVSYNGEFKKNERHGKGIQQWLDGTEYEGDFVYDVVQGYGRKTYRDGSTFRGRFVDGMPEGEGTTTWPDGSGFTGRFSAGRIVPGKGSRSFKDGALLTGVFDERGDLAQPGGVMVWPDGTTWAGEFEVGTNVISGRGTFKWANGMQYVGLVHDGYLVGEGTLRWPSGAAGKFATYRGFFEKGLFEGQGELTFPDGSRYLGKFSRSRFNGEGTFTWSSASAKESKDAAAAPIKERDSSDHALGRSMLRRRGSSLGSLSDGNDSDAQLSTTVALDRIEARASYIGMWKDGAMHGSGVLKFRGGGFYNGEFRHGHLSGRGLREFGNKDTYQGQWSESRFHGAGKYTWAEGGELIGIFSDGVLSGKGRKVYPNGGIYTGEFLNDLEHGKGAFIRGDVHVIGIWEGGILTQIMTQVKTDDNSTIFGGLVSADKNLFCSLVGRETILDEDLGVPGPEARSLADNLCAPWISAPAGSKYLVRGGGTPLSAEHGAALVYDNGDRYFGGIKGGRKHGNGIYVYADMRIIAGEWERDMCEGLLHPPAHERYLSDRLRGLRFKNITHSAKVFDSAETFNGRKSPIPTKKKNSSGLMTLKVINE